MKMVTKSEYQTKDYTSPGFKQGVLTIFFVLLGRPFAQCAREMRLQLLNPIDSNKLLHTIKLNLIDLNELLLTIDHFYLNIARNGSTQQIVLLLPPPQYPVDHGRTMSHLMTIYHSFWRMSSTAIAVHLISANLSIATDFDLGWHPH
jgi:hypothetical protein